MITKNTGVSRLIIFTPRAEIYIRVSNFPIMPIGTSVYLYLTEEAFFEDEPIEGYKISNGDRGISVEFGWDKTNKQREALRKLWEEKITALCTRNLDGQLEYPEVVDFSLIPDFLSKERAELRKKRMGHMPSNT